MSSGSRLLLVGLRGAGKTSYLAALWHLIEAGELPTSLVGSRLQPEREYLNRIRNNWIRFEEVERTSLRGGQEGLSLLLRDAQTGVNIDIILPDLSGELFRLQWATRKATKPYAEFAADSCGTLLFVHPTAVKIAQRIEVPQSDELLLENSRMPRNDDGAEEHLKEWTPNLTPTQVQLVELLQFVAHLRSATLPSRTAVVISAWDLVREPTLPISWLENHLPLLFQFLVANRDAIPFCVYGVSALGGDLERDLKRLQDETLPSRRIKVVQDDLEPNGDLTAPIRFLLAFEDDSPRSAEQ